MTGRELWAKMFAGMTREQAFQHSLAKLQEHGIFSKEKADNIRAFHEGARQFRRERGHDEADQ